MDETVIAALQAGKRCVHFVIRGIKLPSVVEYIDFTIGLLSATACQGSLDTF